MKSPSPAFAFYPKDWLSDGPVRELSHEQRGIYADLLSIYWLEGGLPAEMERLARLVAVPPRRFEKLWPAISRCFKIEENRLVQKRLEEEKAKQLAFSKVQAEKGRKGGKSSYINKDVKPGLTPGLAQRKPEESLPPPPPFPPPPNEEEEEEGGAIPTLAEGELLLTELSLLTGRNVADLTEEHSRFPGSKASIRDLTRAGVEWRERIVIRLQASVDAEKVKPRPPRERPDPEPGSEVLVEVLAELEDRVKPHAFATWFRPLQPVSRDNGHLVVWAPSNEFAVWIEKNYPPIVREAMDAAGLQGVELVIDAPDRAPP